MTGFGKMSEGMLLQILSRLPPKTLVRFKCVAKWWCALISDPTSVAKHLSNSMHNNLTTSLVVKRLISTDTNSNETQMVFSLLNFSNEKDHDHNDGGEHSFFWGVEDIHIPPSTGLSNSVESLHIIGHCDGIVCLALANSTQVYFWNPSIKEFKFLTPQPYLRDWSKRPDPYQRGGRNRMGFGFGPKSRDYKVVSIGFSGYKEPLCFDKMNVYPPRALVYTVSTDTWREIKTDSLESELFIPEWNETFSTNLWPESFQLYSKGICYWLGAEQSKEILVPNFMNNEEFLRSVIILFDLDDEVFNHIQLPNGLYDPLYLYNCSNELFDMRLQMWNEYVTLIGLESSDENMHSSGSFGIWVMDKFKGGNGAWTKYRTIELTERSMAFWNNEYRLFQLIERPVAFWNNKEILIVAENGHTTYYNLETKTLKDLSIKSLKNVNGSVTVVYVRSIISVMDDKLRAKIILATNI